MDSDYQIVGDFCSFLSRTLLSPPHMVLEIGCGRGVAADRLIPYLSSLVAPEMFKVTLADVDPHVVGFVASQWRHDSRVNAVVAATDAIVGDFDLVYYFLSLHHIENTEVEIMSARRLLTKGGMLCICDFEPGAVPFHQYDVCPHDGLPCAEIVRLFSRQGLSAVCSEVISLLPSPRQDDECYPLWAVAARND